MSARRRQRVHLGTAAHDDRGDTVDVDAERRAVGEIVGAAHRMPSRIREEWGIEIGTHAAREDEVTTEISGHGHHAEGRSAEHGTAYVVAPSSR